MNMSLARLIWYVLRYTNAVFILHTCLEQRTKERAFMPAEKCGRKC